MRVAEGLVGLYEIAFRLRVVAIGLDESLAQVHVLLKKGKRVVYGARLSARIVPALRERAWEVGLAPCGVGGGRDRLVDACHRGGVDQRDQEQQRPATKRVKPGNQAPGSPRGGNSPAIIRRASKSAARRARESAATLRQDSSRIGDWLLMASTYRDRGDRSIPTCGV